MQFQTEYTLILESRKLKARKRKNLKLKTFLRPRRSPLGSSLRPFIRGIALTSPNPFRIENGVEEAMLEGPQSGVFLPRAQSIMRYGREMMLFSVEIFVAFSFFFNVS